MVLMLTMTVCTVIMLLFIVVIMGMDMLGMVMSVIVMLGKSR